uniref:Secreted protein n=1 Tax=Trichuris muris TaxID=70415 RepID=A0A5S6QN76_TRIMR
MCSQPALFFTVGAVLLTLCAGETSDCAKDIDDFYVCVKTKYDGEIQKLFDQVKKSTFTEEAAKCFTSNGCSAPKEIGAAPDSDGTGDDEADDDDDADLSMGFEAIQIKKILNPLWFPGETTKNVTATEEECATVQDEKTVQMITQCMQKTLPGFKYPYENGLPTKMDYMAQTGDAFGSMDDLFNDAAETYLASLRDPKTCPADKSKGAQECLEKLFSTRQMTSFGRTLITEHIFRLLCNAGAECHKAARESCQEWILKVRKISCDCASAEEQNVVNALAERYGKCFGVTPKKEEIAKTYRELMKRKCKAMEDDAKQCASVLQHA